eukprot:19915-Heterococcus_DN1.PRE.2
MAVAAAAGAAAKDSDVEEEEEPAYTTAASTLVFTVIEVDTVRYNSAAAAQWHVSTAAAAMLA